MAEVTITINGRQFDISCDAGQEGRIIDLAGYIDTCMGEISQSGAAYNDSHLHILSLLVIADELFEARETSSGGQSSPSVSKKEVESQIREELRAEYAERLSHLETQLANSNQSTPSQPFEDTKDGKNALKVLDHLTQRVSDLTTKVNSL